jgi:hypothetical protein
MHVWGFTKKYKALSWWENHMGGHLSIGPVTIYGANAMCWAVNISTRWGYLCFTLPVIAQWRENSRGQKWFRWHIYLSPNATPWACTWYRGNSREEKIRASIRRLNFGHGFSTAKYRKELYALNQKFNSLHISEWDVENFAKNIDS